MVSRQKVPIFNYTFYTHAEICLKFYFTKTVELQGVPHAER